MKYIFFIFCLSSMFSCKTVDIIDRIALSSSEMNLSNREIDFSELNFQNYREGSSGANGAKAGGGCGCN